MSDLWPSEQNWDIEWQWKFGINDFAISTAGVVLVLKNGWTRADPYLYTDALIYVARKLARKVRIREEVINSAHLEHKAWCVAEHGGGRDCDCGLDKAAEALGNDRREEAIEESRTL